MTLEQEAMMKIRKKPILFFDHILGANLYDKQEEILNSIFHNQRTSVAGCNGPGKTYLVARAVIAFLAAFPDSIVVTTAPTWRQVEHVIWREIRDAIFKSKIDLGLKPLKTRLSIGEKWYAIGVSSDNPDNIRGFHAPHVLVLVDEAAGVMPEILEAIEGMLTSQNVRLVYIGNPTVSHGPFYDSFKSNIYNRIKLSAFDTPNFKANNIHTVDDLRHLKKEDFDKMNIPYPQLVTPYWAWTRLNAWGEETSIFQSLVMANFPKESKDTLINLSWLDNAMNKKFSKDEWSKRNDMRSIGIDVARTGEDSTVFTIMNSFKHIGSDWHYGKDTMETVGKAISLFKEYGCIKKKDVFVVDDIGVGGGVTDRLLEQGYNVIPFNSSAKDFVEDEERFHNNRAQLGWHVKLHFRDGKVSLLDHGKYIKHLSSIKTKFHSNGKIIVIPKDDIKKEIGESPDWYDSYALALLGCYAEIGDCGADVDAVDDEADADGSTDTTFGNIQNEEF